MVGSIGQPPGKLRGIGGHQAATQVGVEITQLVLEHRPAVLEPLLRPPEHHAGPLDQDREQERE